jgi:hypothetical protein
MNTVSKVLFWIFTIALGFVNPLISFALIVLYYLPKIISDACGTCNDVCSEDDSNEDEFFTYEEKGTRTTVRKKQVTPKMDSFSDDTLEDMK